VGAVGRSGRGAALAGTGAGGQGDEELAELSQVETGFVGSAELVLRDGPPVGLWGQAPNTIEEAEPGLVLLAELGSQVVGLADGAEFSEDLVKVIIREVQMRLVQAKSFDVETVAVRDWEALLFAGGTHPTPLAEVESVL
jgi:hypothetical protein